MSLGERDPHTGHMTTGHEWNGIKELNTSVPRPVWYFLSAAALFAVIYWILMPAWPLGTTYTKGLLGYDERKSLSERLALAQESRADWMDQIVSAELADVRGDETLMRNVRETGKALFGDNCAACHGSDAKGGPGFPNLVDSAWLWGGDTDAIMETLRVGINVEHPDTRYAQMPALGMDGMLGGKEIWQSAAYVQSLSDPAAAKEQAADVTAGAALFAENCAACHGDTAMGSTELGAPNLTDASWIYGGTHQAIRDTIWKGRAGQMPSWEGQLSEAQRKILTFYILDLGEKEGE